MIIYNSFFRQIKNGIKQVMSAPVDKDTPNAKWQAARARDIIPEFAAYGGDAWLHPPLTMSQSGAASNADGYGKQYDLNVGQFSNRPTRWGTALDILDTNKLAHEYGLLVLEDAVIHQYDGGYPARTYTELGSNGKPDASLAQKYPECFVPIVGVDEVFDPEGNYSFGDMVSYQNCIPSGYMKDLVIRAMLWRKTRFVLDGGRLDDTKGENVHVSNDIISSVGGWWFGECFTGNPSELELWVNQSGGKRTLDFNLHFAMQSICNNGASLKLIPSSGLSYFDPDHSVLFADTGDTDLNNNENIQFNKLWAYQIMLFRPAAAVLIYAADCELYNLKEFIYKMMWVAKVLAFGDIEYQYVSDTVLVWTRNGNGGDFGWSGGLLTGFSSDPINIQHVWCNTPFGPNRHLQDYLGNGPDIWTNNFGWANVPLGPNINSTARNGVAYGTAGITYTLPIKALPHNSAGSFTDFSDF